MEYVTAQGILTIAMLAASTGAGLTFVEIIGMGADALNYDGFGWC